MEIELQLCPHCHLIPRFRAPEHPDHKGVRVKCGGGCQMTGPTMRTEEEAARAWNSIRIEQEELCGDCMEAPCICLSPREEMREQISALMVDLQPFIRQHRHDLFAAATLTGIYSAAAGNGAVNKEAAASIAKWQADEMLREQK